MKYISILLLFLSSCVAHAVDSDSINRVVDSQKKFFIIRLPSNPTTGYQWRVEDYNKSLFKLVKSHYIPEATNLMGAGGQMNFKFVLKKGKDYPDKSTMVFKYARPWEKTGGTPKTIHLTFKKL